MNLKELLQNQPRYKQDQIWQGKFDSHLNSYDQITTLSKDLREKIKDFPWLSVKPILLQKSKDGNTVKALLELSDGQTIETVLMGRVNKRETRENEFRYTICLSTQVGCPMNCAFCATGKMGFKRNLSVDELVDQYRFWQRHLAEKDGGEVDNIVLMGQGEPLLNYDNVKEALNLFIKYGKIGQSKITMSTCGVIPGMKKMIEDSDFPPVRFALSLHSAIPEIRKKLMPSHADNFFEFLIDWSKQYHAKFTSRTQFIGLEYSFLSGINDDDKNLKALIKLASKLGRVRINLIPYNDTTGIFVGSDMEILKKWQKKLMDSGFTVTIRLSQGQDIAAACGQLRNDQIS
ncbi:MAG TPA: 23S rRNA (adenine(2503)-C(2))-methyltransferase RlmN [Candidatus Magasanikbacteria bacterium]|nr:23S rRNA (adenine(2503)-C(2))-methyltransferase RlmN [Candidatus Magasanikbacteria bacterium]